MNSNEALDKLNKHFNLDCYSFDNDENSKVTEYSIIKQDLDRLEQLEKQIKRWAEKYAFVEKELMQTKKNFKNSQTHSKNCYKKLKGKYEQLEKENQELSIKNIRLKDYKINYQTAIAFMQAQKEEMKKEREENAKLKKALDILISKKVDVNHLKRTKDFNGCNRTRHFYEADYLMEEEYKLLKEVLDSDSN